MRARLVLSLCLAGALSVESCGLAYGQDGISATYGEGVHRYFAGDLAGAREALEQSIDAGSQDPRAFYFRGLIDEAMGADGSADFQKGAKLEALGRRSSPVGSSLTRVQGAVRRKIEKARRDARILRMKEIQEDKVARASAAEAASKSAGAVVPAAVAGGPSPFADGLRSGAVSVDKTQPSTSEVDSGNFAAPATTTPPAASSTAGGGADPFGGEAAAADPFGGAASAPAIDTAADPFGGGATTPATPEMTAPAADPFGAPAASSSAPADPFGGSTGAAEPATSTPAADPFGAPAATSETPAADPFGAGTSPATPDSTARATEPFGGNDGTAEPEMTTIEVEPESPSADPFGGAPATSESPQPSSDPFGSGGDETGADPFGAEKVKENSGAPFTPPTTDAQATPEKTVPKKNDDPFGGVDPFGDS